MRRVAACAFLLAFCPATAHAQPARPNPRLVTPVRVGDPNAPLKLSVWAQQDYSHLAARPAIADAFTAIFSAWAARTPGVQLEMSVMPALELHKAKLLLAAAAGRLPDVASIDSFWTPLFLRGGRLQPLNEFWPADDRADFLPFTIQTLSDRAGNVYGVWHETDCRVLFYRKDLVREAPATWDELLTVASRIARERGIAGYSYNAGRWEATVFDHLPMFWAQGGELVDASGRPIFGQPPHRDRMLRLLRFLRDTIRTGASPRSVLASNDYQQLTAAAIAGDTAMFLGGNWQVNDLRTGLSPAAFANWDIAPIPQATRGTSSTGTGGWVWVVFARDPERRRAAMEFLRFVEAPPNAARISAATGHLPVRQSVYRDVSFFREDPWFARFGEIVKTARARPAVPIYPAISAHLQVAIGYAIAGDKTPEQALDDAWRGVLAEAARPEMPGGGITTRDPIAWLPAVGALAFVTVTLVPFARKGRHLSVTKLRLKPSRDETRPGGASLLGLRGRRAAAPKPGLPDTVDPSVHILGGQARLALWLAPAILLVAGVLLYPMLDLVRLSLTDQAAPGSPYRYTLASFRALWRDPSFYAMATTTGAFVASSVALQVLLGLTVAVLIDAAVRRRVRGTLAARVTIVSAWVVPGVLVGVLWKILLVENRSGLVNYWLARVALGPLPLLSSGPLALASVIVANTWRGCAFSMIMQYAGLQRIPRELHEAADLEGVSAWQRLRFVILPQLAPVLLLNLALVTIYTLNTFDLILPLTGGGPARRTEVVSLFMYRTAFYDLELGRAAAVAMIMLAVNVTLAIAAAGIVRKRA